MPKVKKIVQPPDVQQSLGGHQQAASFVGIEAVELPRAVVMKLAKSTGPTNMKLAKEVPVALTKASTVFINYLVAIAHDIAADRSEKSLSARHVLEACKELGWSDGDQLQNTLRTELEAFRKLNAAKKVQKATSRIEPKPIAHHPESATHQLDQHATQVHLEGHSEDEDQDMQIDELAIHPAKATSDGTDSAADQDDGDNQEEEEDQEAEQ